VQVVENGTNLGYAKGNNAGIRRCRGQYVLFLNSDTIVHEGALQKLVAFADLHPEAGAFGCRVLNPDGSRQVAFRPFPTLWRDWLDALGLRSLASLSDALLMTTRKQPKATNGQAMSWQSGCCVMFRAEILKNLGGFDEQFFYSYEDVDLCWRVWN
jgi:GT2 family glycosyltransferase